GRFARRPQRRKREQRRRTSERGPGPAAQSAVARRFHQRGELAGVSRAPGSSPHSGRSDRLRPPRASKASGAQVSGATRIKFGCVPYGRRLDGSQSKFRKIELPNIRGTTMTTSAVTDVKRKASDGVKTAPARALSADELRKMDAYWRALNYLAVGQIYLLHNPLLKEPLKREHIKPRLLRHRGTSPGLNMLFVHLQPVIKEDVLNVIDIIGRGHGGPWLVAHAYLEGTYSEVYPNISQDAAGMKRLFKQFSFPGGIPSHVAPETPGSIHEGGELGYALSHAYGAAFDNPELIVAAVVGDGEAETGPLATGWHGNKFLNPARDGAVLPILHLNGYKIANPCFLARIPKDELQKFFEGMGYTPYFVEGHDPQAVHQQLADVLDTVVAEIKQIWSEARTNGVSQRPAWPMIVLRTPKGWTCPATIDGKKCEDYWRSHQVPMGEMDKPEHIKILEQWMKSYKPEELFDAEGRLKSEIAELAPKGHRRMSDNPHANGGLLLRDLRMPNFRDYAVEVKSP